MPGEKHYGYAGTILRVNLTGKEIGRRPFPPEWRIQLIGGEAVAAKILYDEVAPSTPALSPDNKVILSMGPLVGTLAPCASRITLTTKSPLTDIYGDSNAGGQWGPEMKYAGYDHVVIEGASPEPVYLWIDDDRVELRDARHLWGKTTWETDDLVKAEIGDETIQVACIGPAGEHLSFAACLILNRARACGRTGLGAVLGSKKLKAIAVRGTKGLQIARPAQFRKECRGLFDKILADDMYGTMVNGTLAIPDRSWDGARARGNPLMRYAHGGKSICDTFEEVSAKKTMEKVWDRNMACFNCPIHCAHWSSIKDGPWKGEKGEGFELNTQENSTYMDTCADTWFLPKYNFLCNQLGLGIDEAAQPVAFAMFLMEKGILTKEDTGGINIRWGDTHTALELMRMNAYREGFGNLLAEGTRKMGRRIGRGAEYWSRNIKGAEVIADTRYAYEVTLAQGVSPRGACHLKGLSLFQMHARNPLKQYPSPEFVKQMQHVYESPYPVVAGEPGWGPYGVRYLSRLMAALDSAGICVFPSHFMLFQAIMLEDLPPILDAATGIPFTRQTVVDAADRARIIQRSFNHRLGLGRKEDYPPQHAFEHPLKANFGGKQIDLLLEKKRYDDMLTEFYRISGYDPQTGVATRETLSRLGLQDVATGLESQGLLPG